MKAAFDGLGIIWGLGATAEEAKTNAVDQVVDLPRDQLHEFIQTLIEGFDVHDVSDALAAKAKLDGGDVQMEQVRVDGKWMLVTLEEAEAGR
jgi:hypothetical protein